MPEENKDTKMVLFNLRMPKWELDRLKSAARDDERSVSSFVRKAVNDKIKGSII